MHDVIIYFTDVFGESWETGEGEEGGGGGGEGGVREGVGA